MRAPTATFFLGGLFPHAAARRLRLHLSSSTAAAATAVRGSGMREQRGFERVAVVGTSVGAAACVMAAAVDPKISLVIAENPLLTCAKLQDHHITKLLGGYFHHTAWSRAMFSIFRRSCSAWLNFRIGNMPSLRCQPMHVIASISPRPVLIMHGTYDAVIPPAQSEQLFALAQEPKELWLAAEAAHCGLYNTHPEEFKRRVIGFLRRHESVMTAGGGVKSVKKK